MSKSKRKYKTTIMSYLSYTAALSQSDTGALTVRIYANEIGGQSWTQIYPGRFEFLCNTYLLEKAWVGGFSDFWGSASPYIPISDGATIKGYYTIWPNNAFVAEELSGFTFSCVNLSGEEVSLYSLIGQSTLYLPEMRVYT